VFPRLLNDKRINLAARLGMIFEAYNTMKQLKYILPVLTLFILSAFVLVKDTPEPKIENTEVNWVDWNQGYKTMMKTGKIGLIDMYTDWCGWCKKMDRDTYAKPDIINKIDDHFVPIKFNPEKNITYYVDTFALTGPELKAWLLGKGGGGYPTTVFMIPDTKTKFTEAGYMGPEQFLAKLNEIVSYSKRAKQ
jgi:thioredoxin-related protein